MKKTLLSLFLAAAALLPAADAQLVALMAPEAKILAGVQADRVRSSPFGQYLLRQAIADSPDFTKFIEATGFDPRYDVREIVVATLPTDKGDRGLIACRGVFQLSKIQATAQLQGALVSQYKGVTLLTEKDGKASVALLDPSIALFGSTEWVQASIDRRTNGTSLPVAVITKIQGLSNQHDMWFYSMQQINPKPGKSGIAIQGIDQLSGGLKFGDLVNLQLDAIARSNEDAQSLVDVGRFLVAMVRGNAEHVPAEVLAALDNAKFEATQNKASLNVSMPEKQLEGLFDMARTRKSTSRKPEAN